MVVSLWSDTHGVDNQPNILESETVNRTANMQSSSKNEIDALDCVSISSHLINLEDSQDSWSSYLISPTKSVIQSAYEVLKFATHSRNNALIVGFYLSSQATAVAASWYGVWCCSNTSTPTFCKDRYGSYWPIAQKGTCTSPQIPGMTAYTSQKTCNDWCGVTPPAWLANAWTGSCIGVPDVTPMLTLGSVGNGTLCVFL